MAIRHQIAFALEPNEGQKATLTSADVLTLAERPTVSTPTQFRERENQSGSLSKGKSTPGITDFNATLALDLIGSRNPQVQPTDSDPPPIRRVLLSGGFKETKFAAIYATTNTHVRTFVQNELVSWDQGGPQTARCVTYARPHAGGVGLLVLVQPTGAMLGGETVTGESANNPPTAVVTSAVLRTVYKYSLVSSSFHVMTANHGTWTDIGTAAVGDLIIKVNASYVAQTGWTPVGVLTAAPIDLGGGDYEFRFQNAVFARQFVAGDLFALQKPDGTIINFGGTPPTVATLVAGDGPSATVQSRLEGKKIRTGVGCRSAIGIKATAGSTATLNVEVKGSFYESIAGDQFSGVTDIDLASIPLFELAAVTLDGRPFPGQSFEMNMNTDVVTLPDYHGTNGIRGAIVGARSPVFTIDPDLIHPTVFDWDAKVRGATSIALHCQIGWQASNGFLIKAPNCQVTQATDGDRDGVATVNAQLAARRVTDNDEVEIIAF